MNAAKRDILFAAPFIGFAVCVIGYGVIRQIVSPPQSWTLVFTVVVSVVLTGQFWIRVGRVPGLPFVGVSVTMLAIPLLEQSPYLGVCIWAIGLAIAQTITRQNLVKALYITGVGAVAAFAFVAVQITLSALGVWLLPSFLLAAAAYYTLSLAVEFARDRGRWALDHSFGISALNFYLVGLLILSVAVAATLMSYTESLVTPWIERDPDASLAPLVMLLAASLFCIFSQQNRYARIERGLSAVLDAAVALQVLSGADLASALRIRARSIVQADDVELRSEEPARSEIGAAVILEPGVNQYLVASHRLGGAPFTREDEVVLKALADIASEAARIQKDVHILEQRANSDSLTGLPNYGAFQQALVEANEDRSYRKGIAVLFIDLDDFKKFNDYRGHHEGDQLLRAVADRLQDERGSRGFVSRVGGDEFVVILTDLASLVQAKESADRIVEAVSQPLTIDGQLVRPVVSVGLAFSNHRELDAQILVVDADRAMLQVKRSRREGGPVEGSSVSIAPHRSTRANDMVAGAIREDKLMLAFQPIVNIDQGKIWAFEALMRYVDPELGPISPSSLVARAKSLGLMNELTMQVVTKALAAADEFYRIENSIVCMTVNLELGQISESELGAFIRDAARQYPHLSLCIELNERSLRSVTDDLRRDAEKMQDAGIIIALDDYGSDDSSVAALVRFPMDILKIDKSLTDDLDDVRQREVLKALQGFGDNLDYTMIVEGIESPAMVDAMVDLGVRNAQGYYFGRPLVFEQMMERIVRSGTQAVIR